MTVTYEVTIVVRDGQENLITFNSIGSTDTFELFAQIATTLNQMNRDINSLMKYEENLDELNEARGNTGEPEQLSLF
jgi:hypothetical protein